MIICQECEAEYEITHDNINEPDFCPFCSSKIRYDDKIDEDWDDEEYTDRGC
jgi:DNA-directed RNA polymerase subunit RPC12/RpoP